MWQLPSTFCAGSHRSATTPIAAGMNSEAMPMVAKKLPVCRPSKCKTPPRYAPSEISQAPHTAYCKKLITMSLNFILITLILAKRLKMLYLSC